MIKIYHNPRCRKSREGLAYLQSKDVDFEVINYLKNPLTEKEFADLLMKLNKKPFEIIRTQEAVFKSNYKGKNFTDDEWIQILVEHPKLIERPIVVKKHKAVIALALENIDALF